MDGDREGGGGSPDVCPKATYSLIWHCRLCLLCATVQILFSPVRRHWLTVHGNHNRVTVYDSISGSASAETKATVQVLAGRGSSVQYCESCTQQTAPGDCGGFAAAYAIAIALGGWSYGFTLINIAAIH